MGRGKENYGVFMQQSDQNYSEHPLSMQLKRALFAGRSKALQSV
jgi:hypothetical protein